MFSPILFPSLPFHVRFPEKPDHLKFGEKRTSKHISNVLPGPIFIWEGSPSGPLQWWRSWGRSSLAVGALLALKSLGEIPGRRVVTAGSAPVPAVVGHLFPADLFREGWGRKKSPVTSALRGSSVTAPPFPPRIKTNISSCILMRHLKVDLLLLFYTHSAHIFLAFLNLSPCVCAGFFFIFPSYLFDLVLHAAFFFEVIGELVIRDQLDSS